MSEAATAPPNPTTRKDRKEMGPWRGTKPAGFILNPELFMRECEGMEVSVRVMNGAKWRGVLQKVHDNGDVLIKPAQELLYDEPDGAPLPEKLLVKSDILWLRRHLPDEDSAAAAASNQPQDEPPEAPSPAKNNQQP
ncbi:Serine/threonine protein kinase [Phytophthora cinnamomi]|uniref:Serine/threonine protein kinase n=1 Tax=Phytophthora cinnamomi TaxID=4785 RepID=UPI00355AACC0|nr:Serine/threonine protein kinase [Phytophthora cinnamomi]